MREEIMIDGVNVAECEYYSKKQQIYSATKPLCKMKDCCMLSNSVKSCKNTDCYFKQLKRLQAENYELKESLKVFQSPDIKKVLTLYRAGEIERIGQENELLEECFKLACDEHKRIVGNYKQALEEIRDYLNTLSSVDSDFTNTETYLRIQDKINEVLK